MTVEQPSFDFGQRGENFRNIPYQHGSITSLEAAKSIAEKAPSMRQRVLNALSVRPMTDEEIAEFLAMNQNSVRPRRIELVEKGLVVQLSRDGEALTRRTKAGRRAAVWSVVR